MTSNTVLDECIRWNERQLRKATDPKDKLRYEENIRNLKEYKEK